MEIATIRRTLNGTLAELERALDRFDVAEAVDLFEVAWHQASQAPPRETREQRALLKELKEVLGSRRWRQEERRLAAQKPRPQQVETAAPVSDQRRKKTVEPTPVVQPRTVWSSDASRAPVPAPEMHSPRPVRGAPPAPGARIVPPRPAAQPRTAPRGGGQPALLEAGRLAELATDLRPLLEQTARAGATITWAAIRKRVPALPHLHRHDESILLWLVDADRDHDEPLLSALVTVGDRQMHPRFPSIAEQLGLQAGHTSTQQRTTWTYEVLRAHQHWRHRH